MPADYDGDGDGKADIAVYRPTTGQWLILRSTAGPEAVNFGEPEVDSPLSAASGYQVNETGTTASIHIESITRSSTVAVPKSAGRPIIQAALSIAAPQAVLAAPAQVSDPVNAWPEGPPGF